MENHHKQKKDGRTKAICITCGGFFKMVWPSQITAYKHCPQCKGKRLDMVGQKYNALTVIKRIANTIHNKTQWLCKCDCGNEIITIGQTLRLGNIKSCGCYRKGEYNPRYAEYESKRVKINCPICGRKIIKPQSLVNHTKTCGSRECTSKWMSIVRTGENNPRWLKSSVGYDTAAVYLKGIEEIRRNPEDRRLLQVRCTYCNKWFSPTSRQVSQRKRVILGLKGGLGESRLYCSDGCKSSCPTYRKKYYPAGFKRGSAREVDASLRKMVLERDNWQCQICGSEENLHCHHIESYTLNKMLAEDMDNCITLCKTHHKWVHGKEGCKYFDLRCQESIAAGG